MKEVECSRVKLGPHHDLTIFFFDELVCSSWGSEEISKWVRCLYGENKFVVEEGEVDKDGEINWEEVRSWESGHIQVILDRYPLFEVWLDK